MLDPSKLARRILRLLSVQYILPPFTSKARPCGPNIESSMVMRVSMLEPSKLARRILSPPSPPSVQYICDKAVS